MFAWYLGFLGPGKFLSTIDHACSIEKRSGFPRRPVPIQLLVLPHLGPAAVKTQYQHSYNRSAANWWPEAPHGRPIPEWCKSLPPIKNLHTVMSQHKITKRLQFTTPSFAAEAGNWRGIANTRRLLKWLVPSLIDSKSLSPARNALATTIEHRFWGVRMVLMKSQPRNWKVHLVLGCSTKHISLKCSCQNAARGTFTNTTVSQSTCSCFEIKSCDVLYYVYFPCKWKST